jgi:hypothetical protein
MTRTPMLFLFLLALAVGMIHSMRKVAVAAAQNEESPINAVAWRPDSSHYVTASAAATSVFRQNRDSRTRTCGMIYISPPGHAQACRKLRFRNRTSQQPELERSESVCPHNLIRS